MASENPHDDVLQLAEMKLDEDKSEEPLPMEVMQGLQAEFAKEALTYLVRNARLRVRRPIDYYTRRTDPDNGIVFSTSVGKALISLGYAYRVHFRKKFRTVMEKMEDPAEFQKYIMEYPNDKCSMYFWHFLEWVAFAFETAVLCYKRDINYFWLGEGCVASYPDLEYFYSRGGWKGLLKFSESIAARYDKFEQIISSELPQDDIILPLRMPAATVEIQKTSSHEIVTPEMPSLVEIKDKLVEKHPAVSSSDPKSAAPGDKVIRKKLKPKYRQKDSMKVTDVATQVDETISASAAYTVYAPGRTIDEDRDSSEEDDESSAELFNKILDDLKVIEQDLTRSKSRKAQESKCLIERLANKVKYVQHSIRFECESESEESFTEILAKQTSKSSKSSEEKSSERLEIPSEQKMLVSSMSEPDRSDLVGVARWVDLEVAEHSSDSDSSIIVSICDVDYSKAIFILCKTFLSKRKADINDPNSEHMLYLKTLSPTDEDQKNAIYVNKVLDESIEKEIYLELGNDAYAICPPGRTIYDEDSQIHFLRDSSEEEDCNAELYSGILRTLKSRRQDRKRSESRGAQESKRTAEMTSEQRECVPSKSKLESKANVTDIPLEKTFVPTKSTGAVPKAKKSDSKKSPIKGQLAEHRSDDLQDSGKKGDEPMQSTSSKKSKKKRRKSKK